jgi:hypothetical protein
MKGIVQYIIAIVLVIVGVVLLIGPPHSIAPNSRVRAGAGGQLQTAERPVFRGAMRFV